MCIHLNCVFIAFYLILYETEGDTSLGIGTIMTFKCKYRHFDLNLTWFQNIPGSRSEKLFGFRLLAITREKRDYYSKLLQYQIRWLVT